MSDEPWKDPAWVKRRREEKREPAPVTRAVYDRLVRRLTRARRQRDEARAKFAEGNRLLIRACAVFDQKRIAELESALSTVRHENEGNKREVARLAEKARVADAILRLAREGGAV